MQIKRIFNMGTAALALALITISCASSDPKSDFELDVDSEEISVAVSKEVARGLMEDLIGDDLECDGDLDGHMKSLLEALDEGGPRAHASYRDGESSVDGRRRGGKLDLTLRGTGSGKIEATMPWAIAECLLGNTTSIDKTLNSSIRVKVTNESGRNFSFKLQ